MLKALTIGLLAVAMVVPATAASREERKAKKQMAAVTKLNEGIEAMKAGDAATAVTLITEAIDSGNLVDQNLQIAYFTRGAAYSKLDQCQSAIPDFTQSIAMTPDAQTYGQRALCYEKMKQLPQAIADVKAAIPLAPQEAVYTGMLCQMTFNAKIYEESAPACESYVVTYNTNEPEIIQAAAQSYELIKNKKKAKEMWQKLLAVDPNSKAAKEGIARTS